MPPGALMSKPPGPEIISALTSISSSASKFKVPWPFEKFILLKTFISPSSLSLSSE